MVWTKRALITQAYEDAGMASYVFDLTPEDLQSALRKLDAMLAMWARKGVNLGYAQSLGPDDGDLDQDSGIPTSAVFAVTSNLAKYVAATYGKTPPPETMQAAKEGYEALMMPTRIPEIPMPRTMPRGAGSRRWGNTYDRFLCQQPTGPVQNTPDGELTLGE